MNKHTPGPWIVTLGRVYGDLRHGGMHGALQSEVCSLRDTPNDANAKLIAAAPDLAEALSKIASAIQVMADNAGGITATVRTELYRIADTSRAALDKAGL